MNIAELRVGNWYKSVKFGVSVQCTLADLYDLCAQSDGAYNDPPIDKMFEPIPLTEEWLLKFGFKKYNYIKNFNWKIAAQGKRAWVRILIQDNGKCCGRYLGWIKYVHQLQNIYYYITEEELTIKK